VDRRAQVDADRLAPLLESLAHGLGLHASYTLLVMNPAAVLPPSARYGYRTGLSAAEMARISDDPRLHALVEQIERPEDKDRVRPPVESGMRPHDPDHVVRPCAPPPYRPCETDPRPMAHTGGAGGGGR
jgi:hypothetical protein